MEEISHGCGEFGLSALKKSVKSSGRGFGWSVREQDGNHGFTWASEEASWGKGPEISR